MTVTTPLVLISVMASFLSTITGIMRVSVTRFQWFTLFFSAASAGHGVRGDYSASTPLPPLVRESRPTAQLSIPDGDSCWGKAPSPTVIGQAERDTRLCSPPVGSFLHKRPFAAPRRRLRARVKLASWRWVDIGKKKTMSITKMMTHTI